MKWQPIETAPVNTTNPVIIDYGGNAGVSFGWLTEYPSGDRVWTIWFPFTGFLKDCSPPKRWQPLPEPPEDTP